MAVLPAIAGTARDLFGNPAAPSLFAAFLMVLAAAALVGFRLAQRAPLTTPPLAG